ncbi:MAG: hypothetical protein U0800_26270 [Isosphaeraceae bacterium]
MIVAWESDGRPHQVELWALLGDKGLARGEMSASVSEPGGVLQADRRILGQELSYEGWARYARSERPDRSPRY